MHVSLGHVIYDLLLGQISVSICGQFGEMINSISARVFDERGRIFIFYKSVGAHDSISANISFCRRRVSCCYTSKYPFPAHDVTLPRPNDSAREQTINLIIATRQCRERVLETGACVRARVYLCTHAYTFGVYRPLSRFFFQFSISF